ncbi:MAG TPA: decarboxylating 6-phosphogluconate dehydrogenase, partial [Intrasporangium sp.]|nr:decarboxylating 6-phosphogluconate dehydrogenase [Intrasporangium sp.]
MQLGLIGLGRMGGNMRERLRAAGHEVIGYDRNPDVSDVPDLKAMVEALTAPRVVWVMVPSGDPTRDTVARLAELLEADDLVIDGGNSRFTDDFENAKVLGEKGIGYVDCGVSGGVWGLENGYGLMCGGDVQWVERAMPVFDALRPQGPREESFVHAGEVGAGHYAKMVHNGIEYGLMHAYAEGYELLETKDIVKDVPGTFRAWSRGTVVRSWLLDLMVDALEEDPHLANVSDYTQDSGEGRWTVEEAIALGVPMPVISASLFA